MSDEAIELFARELAAEVDDAVHSGTGSIYSEEEFTRIVLDRLGDEGAVENPICFGRRDISPERNTRSRAIRSRTTRSAFSS